MNPIPYGRQHITQEDIDAVVTVLRSDYLTQGPNIAAFENAFAAYIGCRYAVAVSNGTAALHLAAMALDVSKNSKVITTPITFAASANCVRYCGGEVIFADIDPVNLLLDIEAVKAVLRKSPKGTYSGIIPVDFAGFPVNMEALRQLADEYDLWILEDACHAPGGYFTDSKGVQQKCGNCTYADAAVFSFHPVKHIATGEGGMITTNRKDIYDKLVKLRTHGITRDPSLMYENHGGWYMEMQDLGYNYRLTDFQAALGLSQLNKAEAGLSRRQTLKRKYDAAFSNNGQVTIINVPGNILHAMHLYVIQVPRRRELYDHLRSHNIFAQVHYIPAHTMPYYRLQGYKKGDFPKAEKYYEQCLSIPMYPSLTDEEQAFVIEKINEFYA
jgi:UDP-4-amino-4,6-dideoxy-N-acetyl-beta-L-altrosamine transaminase